MNGPPGMWRVGGKAPSHVLKGNVGRRFVAIWSDARSARRVECFSSKPGWESFDPQCPSRDATFRVDVRH